MPEGELGPLFENQKELENAVSVANIQGKIPEWINGTYLRVGPGMFDLGKVKLCHYSDGFAMLSNFEIKDGQVKTNKKFLKSEAYKKGVEQGEPYFPEFATKGNIGQQKGFFSRMISAFSSVDVTDNGSINIFQLGNDIFASTETMHITKISPKTLDTCDRIDYSKIFGVHMASPHPLIDSKGDWYNIGTSFTTGSKYNIMKIPSYSNGNLKDALKKATTLCSFSPSNRGYFTYYHTFGMTENYMIFVEQPQFCSDVKLIEAKLKGLSIKHLFEWDNKTTNRFHIIDKRDGKVFTTKFYSKKQFFFFHFANCYEEGDSIVADIVTFPNSQVVEEMVVKNICERRIVKDGSSFGTLSRFVIPLLNNLKNIQENENLVTLKNTTATAFKHEDKIILECQKLSEPGVESPEINPTKKFSKHSYIYASGLQSRGFYENSLCKINVETGEVKIWKGTSSIFPGDPKFIVKANGDGEDDGIIVAACADLNTKKDFLLFLNGKTMVEEGRAIFDVEIPQSIHSIYITNNV